MHVVSSGFFSFSFFFFFSFRFFFFSFLIAFSQEKKDVAFPGTVMHVIPACGSLPFFSTPFLSPPLIPLSFISKTFAISEVS